MTEHIVNFAVGIDDNRIVKLVEEAAVKQIIGDLKQKVMDELLESSWGSKHAKETDPLSQFSREIIVEALDEYKDAIINKAAEYLADKYIRTKAWKEKIGEVMK